MAQKKGSLSPAQIQYLKIGPKIGDSSQSKKLLIDAVAEEEKRQDEQHSMSINGLNKVPKLTYGQFEKTVNNFGVLLNKSFGNETTIHQIQKFGSLAKAVNKIMISEKDKPVYNEKKNALMKKIKDRSDNRTFIRTVWEFKGQKVHCVLKSFSIETLNEKKVMDGLPIAFLRFLVSHVNSSRLAKTIEGAIKTQKDLVVLEFDKMEGKASHLSNSEEKYQNIPYTFERMGQQLKVTLPYLQFTHIESGFEKKSLIENKEILQVLDTDFDNVGELFAKYVDSQELASAIDYQKETQNRASARQQRRQESEQQKNRELQQGPMGSDAQEDNQLEPKQIEAPQNENENYQDQNENDEDQNENKSETEQVQNDVND